jgi:hypothetical protein
MHRAGEVLTFKLGSGPTLWEKTGALDLYRVIDNDTDFLYPPGPPEKKKYVHVNVGVLIAMNKKRNNNRLKLQMDNEGSAVGAAYDPKITITNNGSITRTVTVGGVSETLTIGQSHEFNMSPGNTIKLPSNYSFDILKNSYNSSRYSFTTSAKLPEEQSHIVTISMGIQNFAAGTSDAIPTKYIVSYCGRCNASPRKKNNGSFECKSSIGSTKRNVNVQGFVYEASGKSSVSVSFRDPITVTCTEGGVGVEYVSDA